MTRINEFLASKAVTTHLLAFLRNNKLLGAFYQHVKEYRPTTYSVKQRLLQEASPYTLPDSIVPKIDLDILRHSFSFSDVIEGRAVWLVAEREFEFKEYSLFKNMGYGDALGVGLDIYA